MKDSNPLLPAERQQRILDILREEFTARSSRLSELMRVSEMTIRRDLDTLEAGGLIERTHGGAVFRQERVAGKFRYSASAGENLPAKQNIAKRAAAMIEPHDAIYIGEGVTTAHVVRYADPEMPFSIFTNNLGVIPETTDKTAELILLAGTYYAGAHAVAGPLTMEMIPQVNASKVFLGVDGLSLGAGLTTPDLDIAVVERSMIRHTRGQVVAMADHQKFGLVAQMSIAPLKNIDVLITDREIPRDFRQDLEAMGIQVVIA